MPKRLGFLFREGHQSDFNKPDNITLAFLAVRETILAPAVILVVQAVAEADLAALEGAVVLLEVAVEVFATKNKYPSIVSHK